MTKVLRVKSFVVCWVHQVCGVKFCDFFHHHLHTFMVFRLYKTTMRISTKALHSSSEFSLKPSLAYSEMDESTLLTRLCRFHAFQDDHAVTGEELQLKRVRDVTDR